MLWTLVAIVVLAILLPLLKADFVTEFWRDAFTSLRGKTGPVLRRIRLVALSLLQLIGLSLWGLLIVGAGLLLCGAVLLGIAFAYDTLVPFALPILERVVASNMPEMHPFVVAYGEFMLWAALLVFGLIPYLIVRRIWLSLPTTEQIKAQNERLI